MHLVVATRNKEEIDVVCDIHIGCADIKCIIGFKYSNNKVINDVPTEDTPDLPTDNTPTATRY